MSINLKRSLNVLGLKIKKHSPEILIGAGIVGVIGSGVLACKATLKINDVVKEHDDNKKSIEAYVNDNGYSDEYTEEDHKKDLLIVKSKKTLDLIKLYSPSVLLCVASLSAIICSHKIVTKRNIALTAAYSAVEASFKDYRDRVVERFGSDIDRELRYNIKKKEYDNIIVDDNGKEKVVKETVSVIDGNNVSEFAMFFDEASPNWTKNAEMNKFFLIRQQQYFNDKLKADGFVFLNDVYKALGLQQTKAGQIVGWVYDTKNKNHEGDNYIDFGIFEINREANRDFVNGYERVVLLDFNVDGNILDKI